MIDTVTKLWSIPNSHSRMNFINISVQVRLNQSNFSTYIYTLICKYTKIELLPCK